MIDLTPIGIVKSCVAYFLIFLGNHGFFCNLQGTPIAVYQFNGRYMVQYEFAEETRAELNSMRSKSQEQ